MRTLFVHQNFPAQFKHLAPALAAMPGHHVLALTDAASKRPEIVKTVRYTFTPPDKDAIPLLGRNYTWRAARGEAVPRRLPRDDEHRLPRPRRGVGGLGLFRPRGRLRQPSPHPPPRDRRRHRGHEHVQHERHDARHRRKQQPQHP